MVGALKVVNAGASFPTLSEGWQNAIQTTHDNPIKVRADNLSAAHRIISSWEEFTERYYDFINRCGLILLITIVK